MHDLGRLLHTSLLDLALPGASQPQQEGASLTPELEGEPEDMQGTSLAFAEAGEAKGPRVHWRSVQDERWKYIFHPRQRRLGLPAVHELYDLEQDPGETENLVERRKRIARELRGELRAWMGQEKHRLEEPRQAPEQDETTEDALRALGYIE